LGIASYKDLGLSNILEVFLCGIGPLGQATQNLLFDAITTENFHLLISQTDLETADVCLTAKKFLDCIRATVTGHAYFEFVDESLSID